MPVCQLPDCPPIISEDCDTSRASNSRRVMALAAARIAEVGTPVVALGALLGAGVASSATAAAARVVTMRVGARQVALAVDGVVGVRNLDPGTVHGLPPLLRDTPVATSLGALDGELVSILEGSRILPDEVWAQTQAATS